MRLREFQIKQICQRILDTVRTQNLVVFKRTEAECLNRMIQVFQAELKIEEVINQEAERILAQYERSMGSQLDRQKMFELIKKQLIKDKKVIL